VVFDDNFDVDAVTGRVREQFQRLLGRPESVALIDRRRRDARLHLLAELNDALKEIVGFWIDTKIRIASKINLA